MREPVILHHRAAFTVSTSDDASIGDIWATIVKRIRKWVSRNKDNTSDLFKSWFFNFGEYEFYDEMKSTVRTCSYKCNSEDNYAKLWAIRFEHNCSEEKARRWRVDITLDTYSDQHIRFVCNTLYWNNRDYIGRMQEPKYGSPNIIKEVISDTHSFSHAGSEKLTVDPIICHLGNDSGFIKGMLSSNRQCPIVYISRQQNTNSIYINPSILANKLAGCANVYLADDYNYTYAIDEQLPKHLRCYDGAIRVYYPKVDVDNIQDQIRHRYFTRERILDVGEQNFQDILVKSLSQRAMTSTRYDFNTYNEVLNKRNRLVTEGRLAELRKEVDGGYKTEAIYNTIIDLYEEDIQQKESEIGQLKDACDNYCVQNEILQENIQNIEDKMAEVEYRNRTLNEDNENLRGTRDEQTILVEKIESIGSVVRDMNEVCILISHFCGDCIVIHEEVYKGIKGLKYASMVIPWSVMMSIVELHSIIFNNDFNTVRIASEYKSETGYELAWTETGTTKSDGKLMAIRKIEYKGEEVDIVPHVKCNVDGKPLRIYFYIDSSDKKVVVGHIGTHIQTGGSRRRRQKSSKGK